MMLALKTDGPVTEMRLLPPDGASEILTTWDSGRQLADQLLGRIETLLGGHHAQLSDLTAIIIFSGPGSFTSLRIGHTVANALAESLGIPAIGAAGDDWVGQGRTLAANRSAKAQSKAAGPALPLYGADAHITKPQGRRGDPQGRRGDPQGRRGDPKTRS